MLSWTGENAVTGWIEPHPHAAKRGLQAAGDLQPVRTRPVLVAVLAGAALVCAAPAQAGTPKPKTVRIYDNYFLKDRLTVKVGTTVIWRVARLRASPATCTTSSSSRVPGA